MFDIVEKIKLCHTVYLLKVRAPKIASKRKAGQFVVLRVHEQGERIPLTIVDSEEREGTISLIVQEVGRTTDLLCGLDKGNQIMDVVGPLGRPTHIENFGTAVCIGGGIGVAPVYPISRALKEVGNRVISIIGARTKGILILEDEMKGVSDELFVTTDDGSYGHHGFVTQLLQKLIDDEIKMDMVFAIGPVPMMKAVCNVTKPYNIRTVVSLNPIMVDGTGMCGACRVTIGGENRFVCVDGPEFDGHMVDFDELIKRNRSYLREEKIAMEEFTYREGSGSCERCES